MSSETKLYPDCESLFARYISEVLGRDVSLLPFRQSNRYPRVFAEAGGATTVLLNELECRLCRFLGKHRYLAARSAGMFNARQGPQADDFTDREGVAGEMAFAKLFDLYPLESLRILPRKTEEDHGDIVLRCGAVVDVKTTKYRSGKLQAALWKTSEASVDLYALMVGTLPVYRFCGFYPRAELCRDERIGTFPGRPDKPCYMVEQSELMSTADALKHLEKKCPITSA